MNFLANSPKTVFFNPVRLRVETYFSPSKSTSSRPLFAREKRCSEETVVDWHCASFGSSLPISCSSLLLFKRSIFGIRGAGPTLLTAPGGLFAVLRHSDAEMARYR